jgi:UDP-glucose:glycoprotein glucosyltransferase
MIILFLPACIQSAFRRDHAVSLDVVAPWYDVPLFEQLLFFMSDYSDGVAATFLNSVLLQKQINNETHLWTTVQSYLPSDYAGLLRSQIDVRFYLPRAELYRETARTYDGSRYAPLFSVGDPIPDVPHRSGRSNRYEFDLELNGKSLSFVYADLHNETVAEIILKLISDGTKFTLRPLAQTAKFGVNLPGFGIEVRPFKYSMEYGVKDTAKMTQPSAEMETIRDETVLRVNGTPPIEGAISSTGWPRTAAVPGMARLETHCL